MLTKPAQWQSYPKLKWLDDKEALKANAARGRLIKDILPKVNVSFLGKKLHLGPLSPGCAQCVRGTWTCGFFSSECNASCFFCRGGDIPFKDEHFLSADGLIFKKEEDFLTYLEKMYFSGVSFSGGECLLHLERLLKGIRMIRGRFGNKIHLWLYTNGYLVDEAKLKKLRQAGLDEIRINISADRYNLRAVRLSKRFIPTVTVEIPMIPEDYDTLLQCLSRLKEAGCAHLNIHQILATEFNHKKLAEHGYTLLRSAYGTPTLESELAALELLKAASEANIGLPINYCAWEYRCQVTGWSRRRRAALLAKTTYEEITPAGYLRRISLCGKTETMEKITQSLRQNKELKRDLWEADKSCGEVHIHPDLLNYFDFQENFFTVRYFECHSLIGSMSVSGHRTLNHQESNLSASALRSILGVKDDKEEKNVAAATRDFERIREGFPEIC